MSSPSVHFQTGSEPNGLFQETGGSNILYAVVARGTNVLAQYSAEKGNYEAIAARILAKVPEHNVKSFYENDNLSFNFLISDGITYLCIARWVKECFYRSLLNPLTQKEVVPTQIGVFFLRGCEETLSIYVC